MERIEPEVRLRYVRLNAFNFGCGLFLFEKLRHSQVQRLVRGRNGEAVPAVLGRALTCYLRYILVPEAVTSEHSLHGIHLLFHRPVLCYGAL